LALRERVDPPRQARDDTLPARLLLALLGLAAVQHALLRGLVELLERQLEIDVERRRQRLELLLVEGPLRPSPGRDRAAAQRQRRIRHHQLGIELRQRAETAALRAGAFGAVEREA